MAYLRRFLTKTAVIIFSLIISTMAHAGTQVLNVGTAQQLQNALNQAEGSTVDTRIILAAGDYLISQNGGNPFEYLANNNKSLTLEGAGTGETVLIGQGIQEILNLTDLTSTSTKQLHVMGITFQNGATAPAVSLETSDANIRVENCEFLNSQNPSTDGGGASLQTIIGDITLTNNLFSGNISGGLGGGARVFTEDGMIAVTNNIFFMNQGDGGGAIFVDILFGATVDFTNNTLTENNATSGNGGGLLMEVGDNSAVINIFNSIVFNNNASDKGNDIFLDNNFGPNADFQLFNNAFMEFCQFQFLPPDDCNLTLSPSQMAGGNIQQNPLIADPGMGNFTLEANSPAIDAGVDPAPSMPTTDFAGNPRPFGPLPDMGALEAVPIFAADPTSINFGTTPPLTELTQTFTLFNNGNYPLMVTNFAREGDTNFTLDPNGGSNPCGSTTPSIATGGSCTMEITFGPNGDATFNAKFTFTSDDPNNPTIMITVTGIGGVGSDACALGTEGPPHAVVMLMLIPILFLGWRFFKRS